MEAVANDRPSVILLDVNLGPDEVGKQWDEMTTLSELSKCADYLPPVMILTGNKFNLDLRRTCFIAGCSDFMLKDEANRNPELLCERLYHCFLRALAHETRA